MLMRKQSSILNEHIWVNSMTTKKYLEQIGRIEQLILNKRVEEMRIRELCGNISVRTDGERVMSSNISDPTGRLGSELAEISRQIDKWFRKRQHIINQIDMIDDVKAYNILTYRYVQQMSITQLMETLDRTERQVYKLLNDSVRCFEQKYGETYLTVEK